MERTWLRTGSHRRPTEERFWEKVDQTGGPDACWPWVAGRTSRGYGAFKNGGVQLYAHRFVLTLIGRPLEEGQYACHHCDNPPCCNPAHIYAGSVLTNNRDTVRRGRSNFTADRRERVSASVRQAYKDGRHQRHVYRSTCKRGHPLVEGNLYYFRSRDPSRPVKRRCRTCTLDYIHSRKRPG